MWVDECQKTRWSWLGNLEEVCLHELKSIHRFVRRHHLNIIKETLFIIMIHAYKLCLDQLCPCPLDLQNRQT
jgi:hypothetical protein